jgi:hypothetical protein
MLLKRLTYKLLIEIVHSGFIPLLECFLEALLRPRDLVPHVHVDLTEISLRVQLAIGQLLVDFLQLCLNVVMLVGEVTPQILVGGPRADQARHKGVFFDECV